MTFRQNAVRTVAVSAAAAAIALVTNAVAAADVPPRTPGIMGDDIVQLDNSGPCNGPIHVVFETSANRPGNLSVLLTPRGTFGASPACATNIQVDWINGIAPFTHTLRVPVDNGPTRIDVPTGAGVSLVNVSNFPLRALAISSYVLVP